MELSKFVPQAGINLVKYTGSQFIDKLGLEIVQNVVASILSGKNVRDLTESLTQRRILLMNSSILVAYLRALSSNANLEDELTQIIKSNLKLRISPAEKTYLYWFLGLTGKSIQNVVRDTEGFSRYLDVFDENLKQIAEDIEGRYGDLSFKVDFEGKNIMLRWPNLLRCLLAVGAQTLTVRGSEKSLYGKMFEKLMLGSVLSLLGFEYIKQNDTSKCDSVFWLSEREDKRESDATVLVRPGVGVRFDIGFIGKGNTEVSLDKVTRFEHLMERAGRQHNTITIILVDTIGENSRIQDMAIEIGGHILQMSETYWVYKLSRILKEECGYNSKIANMSMTETIEYIKKEIHSVDLGKFIDSKTYNAKIKDRELFK